jgi:hypothetical protein
VLDTRPRAGGPGPELVPGDTSIFRERGGQAGVCGVAGGATSRKAQGHGNRAIKEMRTHLFWCVRIFVKPSFSFLGLSAWRWACASPRCGSMWPHSGQRKQQTRTPRQSALGSDLLRLVPMAGLEPARCCHRWILSPLRLPIPSHRRIALSY